MAMLRKDLFPSSNGCDVLFLYGDEVILRKDLILFSDACDALYAH